MSEALRVILVNDDTKSPIYGQIERHGADRITLTTHINIVEVLRLQHVLTFEGKRWLIESIESAYTKDSEHHTASMVHVP